MPTPSGVVALCKNALLPRDYSHTIDFRSPSEQQSYWASLVKYRIDKVPYIRKQRQYIVVNYSLEDLQDVNYLYFKSVEDGKIYYCFVVDKEYSQPKVTFLYFDVDVLQTRMFDYQVKQSYVIREHCDRWDADHKPIYSITTEDLDYGTEYTTEAAYRVKSNSEIDWFLAICGEHNNLISEGTNAYNSTIDKVANPYVFYLLPSKQGGGVFKEGTETTTGDVRGIVEFVEVMSQSNLGNYVKQIVKLPYLPFNFKIDGNRYDTTPETNALFGSSKIQASVAGTGGLLNTYGFMKIRSISEFYSFSKKLADMGVFEGIESAMPTEEQWKEIKSNPYNVERDRRFESKLLTHPYRYNIFTDWKNQPIVIKNEYIAGDKISVKYTQSIGFNAPARYWLENYKKDPEGRNSSLNQLAQEDIPVVTDAYYTYMLQNKNQIEANKTNALVASVSNIARSTASGAAVGGWAGAAAGAVSGFLTSAVDYQALIRSENAKQTDIKNLPDSIVNSNDASFNTFDNNKYITLYRMKIACEFEEKLADAFAMTGYTVKRLKVPDTKSRVRFNYVKTIGANIVGSFDQGDVAILKAIYDNGVTFWHYNTENFKMFDYSLENIERRLL